MTRRTKLAFTRWAIAPIAVLGMATLVLAAAPEKTNFDAARLETYQHADGATYFALSLTPTIDVAPAKQHQVVVLMDTSASQTGVYREKALEAIRTLLFALDADDRVRLMAGDLKAVSLTDGFVAPNGAEMKAALAKLERRVPLASTDMPVVLSTAAESFGDADAATPRSLIYIGDAITNPGFDGAQFKNLVSSLADQRIAMTSYAIGPKTDTIMMAALANQTGGMLFVDTDRMSAKEYGTAMADVARETVIWPTSIEWPKGLNAVYPERTPPLRMNRDTIVLGEGSLAEPATVRMVVDIAGKAKDLSWDVRPVEANEDNTYLSHLVKLASADGGYTLPTVGTEGLRESRRLISRGAHQLSVLSRQAASAGNKQDAARLAEEALRRDPHNTNALALKKAIHQRAQAPLEAEGEGDLRLVETNEPEEVQTDSVPADEGSFLEEFERENRIREQILVTEINAALNDARDQMATAPLEVEQNLKLMLERVLQAPELDDAVRAQLRDRLEATLRETARRAVEREIEEREALARAAEARDRLRVLDNLTRDQLRVEQLIERFNGLLAEGRYVEAEEVAAAEARALEPDLPAAVTASLVARTAGFHVANLAYREAREKNFMEVLALVQKSSIPFPDEPPIVYPEASVWRDLTESRKKFSSVDLKAPGGAEEKIINELAKPTQVDFIETPINQAMEFLQDYHDIAIVLNRRALDDVGLDPETTTITRSLKGISLRSALRLILQEHDLTYVIQDEVLQITTPDQANQDLVTKVYPVADLVLPIPQAGMGMMGGMGGGMMGGMGGGMGGMGGGMGGMGGGMGGMGGGMGGMGGGFMNAPDDLRIPAPGARGLQAFAVPDDLKLTKKSAEAKIADDAPASTAAPDKQAASKELQAIELSIPAGTDPEAAWMSYFESLETPDPIEQKVEYERVMRDRRAAIRETARQLVNKKKFDETIGMIQAALRHRHVQPWMYETLHIAMHAKNATEPGTYSNDDIERVLMSAADFASSPSDLMLLAAYMSRVGLDERALKIFKQVSAIEPTRHECYVLGLRLAQRIGDLEAIQWACVGVLSQAWPASKQDIVREARTAAEATLERLSAQNRKSEAVEFKALLDNAATRDCLVRVSWTGEADIDLMIEEPTGTVCSLRNPRTTAGGVMRGASASSAGKTKGVYSEEYVVPQGFSGVYRMLVRRVWGKVATGKVTVDIYSHYGTEQQTHLRKQIPVGEQDALVVFDLQNGRRKEPLEQQQIANAAAEQVAINRAILGQHLGSITNPDILDSIGGSRDPRFPFFRRRGAVGYQPVIERLPEGMSMTATAVISADRRYVRITPSPIFTAIGEVTTFNFATGEGGTQGNAGAGGAGGSGLGGGGLGGGGGFGGGFQ